MDNIVQVNRDRWNAMASANVMHSLPYLDYTPEKAAEYVCRHNILKDVKGQKVLCLASGGGQDSVAFSLMGADVTVLDLSDVQLSRDREAALHFGYQVETFQGDMRDLSMFPGNHFDVVWQSYSINFIPKVDPVIAEASRVLKNGGTYRLAFANPYALALDSDSWNGTGYLLRGQCIDGEDISKFYPEMEIEQVDGSIVKVKSPHEFRHNLSTLMNSAVKNGFIFLYLHEHTHPEQNPEPGSWPHYTQAIPIYLGTYWRLSMEDGTRR